MPNIERSKLEAVAKQIDEMYRRLDWFQAVGIGDGKVIVYCVKRPANWLNRLHSLDGVPVNWKVIGKVRAS